MDRRSALEELPMAYAVALRMHDAGAGDDAIAAALGVPVESVAGLVAIGESKLRALLGASDDLGDERIRPS